MKLICLALAAAMLCFCAATVSAQNYEYLAAPNTVRIMGGVSFTDGGDFGTDTEQVNDLLEGTGFDLGDPERALSLAAAWERHITPHLALGLEGQFHRISAQDDLVSQGTREEIEYAGSSWGLMANALLTPTPDRNIYFGAGAGMAYAKVTGDVRRDDEDLAGVETSAWAPAFQGFVGFMLPMGPRSVLGIQGTYRFHKISMDEGMLTIDGEDYQSFDMSDDKYEFDLSGPAISIVFSRRL